ncbi:MAG: hypothetical protein ACYC2H_02895 [Thermoplasmatota archaeon]
MRPAFAAVLIAGLSFLAPVQALSDASGDVDQLDVVQVTLALGNGTATVEVQFADEGPADGAGVRGVVLLGEPGAAEPAEWYQFTVANATHAFAAHGTPRDARVVSSQWTNGTLRLEFERVDEARTSCAFAVVESGLFGAGGFERLDVAPRGFSSMERAWPVEACPRGDLAEADEVAAPKDSPGLGLVALLGLFGVALFLRRR